MGEKWSRQAGWKEILMQGQFIPDRRGIEDEEGQVEVPFTVTVSRCPYWPPSVFRSTVQSVAHLSPASHFNTCRHDVFTLEWCAL